MDTGAQIGPSIRVKGDVTAQEPLTIAGRIEGSVTVDGHTVTLLPGGSVAASMSAHTLIIRGTVEGTLLASERIVFGESAVVDGEATAPAISLSEGATVNGILETTSAKKPALSKAS